MFIGVEQAARRRCGNPAGAGQPQDDCARNEVFFGGAVASALGQRASAVRDAGGVGECDVKSMLASTRAIADQCRRGAKANQISAHSTTAARHQPGGARACALCHRDCGVGIARLCRCKAEIRRKRLPVVGNLCLDQQPRAAGNTKQLADRATAAPGDRERRLAAGRVQCRDQLSPRGGVHRAHGVCRPKLKNTSRTVKDRSDRVNRVRGGAGNAAECRPSGECEHNHPRCLMTGSPHR